jgi:nitroreductase
LSWKGNKRVKPRIQKTPIQAIYERRAVRDYKNVAVPQAKITELLHAAVQAPSAVNQQPWAFAIFQGREKLKSFSDRAKPFFAKRLDAQTPDELRRMLSDPDFNIFYNANTLIVICARPDGMNPAEDCCLAAQNLMLAAHATGLATCPIGLARPWLNSAEVKQELGIPEKLTPIFPLIVGYAATTPPAVPRNPPDIVVWSEAVRANKKEQYA